VSHEHVNDRLIVSLEGVRHGVLVFVPVSLMQKGRDILFCAACMGQPCPIAQRPSSQTCFGDECSMDRRKSGFGWHKILLTVTC